MITMLLDSKTLADLRDNEESYVLFKVDDQGNGYQDWEEVGIAGSETDIEEMVPEGDDPDLYVVVKIEHNEFRFRNTGE